MRVKRVGVSILAAVLLAVVLQAEPTFIGISVTQNVQSKALPRYTQSVTIVSDGSSTCYFRLFTDVDTPGDATADSMPLKATEWLPFTLVVQRSGGVDYPTGVRDSESFNGAGQRARYYKSISCICATGGTATWRVYAK